MPTPRSIQRTYLLLLLGLLAHSAAVAEERYLEGKFGDQYREYRSRVRRGI